jgi:hypothetical protein
MDNRTSFPRPLVASLCALSMFFVASCRGDPAPPADASTDTGPPDPGDAGVDGGRWTPPTSCDGTDVDVYAIPPGIPDFTPADRGRVISCGRGEPISAATADARAREHGYEGPTLTSNTVVTRVLYQVERSSGEAGFSTGALYVPEGGTADAPLVVYVSGTTGLGDDCAPSRGRRFTDLERALYVLIGTGHVVFVPDLVGLGTPGTPAWLEPHDAGRSVLDGARAALAIAPEGLLSGEIVIAGHSAGGHAALAAQAFQRTYAPSLNVLGVGAIAAAWIDTSLFALMLSMSDYSTTDPATGWNVVYGGMYFVGHSAAYDGEEHAWDPIAPPIRDQVRRIYETRCLDAPEGMDLRTGIAELAPNVGALFEGAFRSSVANCYLGLCDDVGMRWMERWRADRPALDPMGAPIWFHHGTEDRRIALADMACPIRMAMRNDARTRACVYEGANHNDVVTRAAPWLVAWIDALAAGDSPPDCPDPTELPRCGSGS